MIEHNGAVFLAGQFCTTNRAGRVIISMHVDITDLAEQIITRLQLSNNGATKAMSFLDGISGGGGAKILKFDGRAGNYVARGLDAPFNNQEFVADIYAAKGGYIKFGDKGQAPERHLGSVFPKDEAPLRATLGNTDKNEWTNGKFSDEPEDPWTAIIEIPLRHRESGDLYTFTAQTKTSLAAAKDFLGQCRRLSEGFEPLVRLCISSFKGKFGVVKKPLLSIIGKVPMEGDDDAGNPFDDEIPFK